MGDAKEGDWTAGNKKTWRTKREAKIGILGKFAEGRGGRRENCVNKIGSIKLVNPFYNVV